MFLFIKKQCLHVTAIDKLLRPRLKDTEMSLFIMELALQIKENQQTNSQEAFQVVISIWKKIKSAM